MFFMFFMFYPLPFSAFADIIDMFSSHINEKENIIAKLKEDWVV